MTFQSSPTVSVPASRGIGAALRMLRSRLRMFWVDYQTRREMRAFVPASDMNDYLLRDIGASDRLVPEAAARRSAHRERGARAHLAMFVLTAAIMVIAAPDPAKATEPQTTSRASSQEQAAGFFTGTFERGAPVYRLPPVNVVAVRKVELARMEREERLARARQARAKGAGRDPV